MISNWRHGGGSGLDAFELILNTLENGTMIVPQFNACQFWVLAVNLSIRLWSADFLPRRPTRVPCPEDIGMSFLFVCQVFPQTVACQHGVLALNLYNWLWCADFCSRKRPRVFQEFCSAVDILELSLFKTLLWPPPKFQKRSAPTWSLSA